MYNNSHSLQIGDVRFVYFHFKRCLVWVINMMQKLGGKVDQLVRKSGDFIAISQQKLIDTTLSVEQMETTADIAPDYSYAS